MRVGLLDLLHERLPDKCGKRAAGDRLAPELREHRAEGVRIADPDGDDEVGRVADEPRVAVVVRRPGLAGDLQARNRGAPTRPLADDVLEEAGDELRMSLVQDLMRVRRVLVDTRGSNVVDGLDHAWDVPESEPSTRRPSLASVAYARASSSGLTAAEPSPMEKYGWSRLWMPRLWAVFTISFGPTRSVSWANTELSDDTMARETLTRPR